MNKQSTMHKIIIISVIVVAFLAVLLTGCNPQIIEENVTIENANLLFSKVAENLIDSTVTITCNISGGTSGGSGVVVSNEGHILTNYHVVQNALNKKAKVTFTDKQNPNKTYSYNAVVLDEKNDGSKESKMDLAVLKIDDMFYNAEEHPPVNIKSEDVSWGEYGIIIGNPKQLGSLCAHAMVSNPGRKMSHVIKETLHTSKEVKLTTEFITLDAPVNAGNSGGGFFDSNGRLAGIVTLRQYDKTDANENVTFGIGYAIPAKSIVNYLARYDIKLK